MAEELGAAGRVAAVAGRPLMRHRLGPAVAIGLSVAMIVAGVVFASMTPALLGGNAGGFTVFVGAIGVLALTSIAVGSLIRLRVPANPIGTVLIVDMIRQKLGPDFVVLWESRGQANEHLHIQAGTIAVA